MSHNQSGKGPISATRYDPGVASAHVMIEKPQNATEQSKAPSHELPKPLAIQSSPAEVRNTSPIDGRIAALWDRIKHHKVVQWTLAYLALAYTLLHGAELLGNSTPAQLQVRSASQHVAETVIFRVSEPERP